VPAWRAPGIGLGIQALEIDNLAGGKEVVADVADSPLDPAFFVATSDRDRTWVVMIVGRECKQRGIKADGIAMTFDNGTLEIIVEQNPGNPIPGLEGSGMTGQETLHAGIQEEAQEDGAGVAEDRNEGHQRPFGAADGEVAEVPPVRSIGSLDPKGVKTSD